MTHLLQQTLKSAQDFALTRTIEKQDLVQSFMQESLNDVSRRSVHDTPRRSAPLTQGALGTGGIWNPEQPLNYATANTSFASIHPPNSDGDQMKGGLVYAPIKPSDFPPPFNKKTFK